MPISVQILFLFKDSTYQMITNKQSITLKQNNQVEYWNLNIKIAAAPHI